MKFPPTAAGLIGTGMERPRRRRAPRRRTTGTPAPAPTPGSTTRRSDG